MKMIRNIISRYDNGNNNPGNGYNNGNNNGNGNGSGNGGPNGGKDPKRQNIILFVIAAVITLLLVSYFMTSMSAATQREVSYTQFLNWIDQDDVKEAEITDERINFTLKDGVVVDSSELSDANQTAASSEMQTLFGDSSSYAQVTYYTANLNDDTLLERLNEHNVEINGVIPNNSGLVLSFLLTYVLPIALMWILLSFLFRRMSKGGGMLNVGKSNAKVYGQKKTGITFKDVAGEDEAKDSLIEVVDFLHNPGKYSQIGAKLPKGALLVGPPGTGKTLLAKAVAGEAGVPFFSMAGSDFIELYVGVGASRVRDLFKEAEKNAPCIIFIDEIDAIGRSRDSKFGGGNDEREQTLNQLLSEMDGFDGKKGVIILAATNRPEVLDKALLRPGRFDRRIIVDKPDLKGRIEILKVHSKDVLMDDSVDLEDIALATSGAVGSDLANMINEAAINAVKMGRNCVQQVDLFDAVEQVLVGKEKKDRIMSKEERKIVSYHEVGHALIAALQKNSEPVQKITIVPRTMGALGYVMQVPEEEKYLNTEAELRDMLVSLLGGRAAEEIVFDTVTTGASNDIEKATSIARSMITQYGMSKKFGLIGLETTESQYLDGRKSLNCADTTAADIDTEIMKLLKSSYKKAKALLRENRELMDKLAEFLIEKETITGKEFMKIYRKEKGLPEPVEDKEKKKKEEQKKKTEQKISAADNKAQQVQPDTSAWHPDGGYHVAQNPYQQQGNVSRQDAWEEQYRQGHWSNNQNQRTEEKAEPTRPTIQKNPYQDGAYKNDVNTRVTQTAGTGRFSQVSEQVITNPVQVQPVKENPVQPVEQTQVNDSDIILEAATKMEEEEAHVRMSHSETQENAVEEVATETDKEAEVKNEDEQ